MTHDSAGFVAMGIWILSFKRSDMVECLFPIKIISAILALLLIANSIVKSKIVFIIYATQVAARFCNIYMIANIL